MKKSSIKKEEIIYSTIYNNKTISQSHFYNNINVLSFFKYTKMASVDCLSFSASPRPRATCAAALFGFLLVRILIPILAKCGRTFKFFVFFNHLLIITIREH